MLLFLESRCDEVRDTGRRPEFDDAPLNHKTTRAIYSDAEKERKKDLFHARIFAERESCEAGATTQTRINKLEN